MANIVRIENIAQYEGQEVTIRGWLYAKTGKGRLQFLRVRDGTGIVQVVAFKPDLIVLSIAGPETDGFEVCEKIKGDPETEYIRIVGIVGFTEDRKIGEMLRCGADDFLIKPFQMEELQQSVRYLTSRKAAVDHAR